jgi:hypothetical protein
MAPKPRIESAKIILWVQKLVLNGTVNPIFVIFFSQKTGFQPKFEQNQPRSRLKYIQVAVGSAEL